MITLLRSWGKLRLTSRGVSNMVWNKNKLWIMKSFAVASLLYVLGYLLGGPWWFLIMAMVIFIPVMILYDDLHRRGMAQDVLQSHRYDEAWRKENERLNEVTIQKLSQTPRDVLVRKLTPEVVKKTEGILEGKYIGQQTKEINKKRFHPMRQLSAILFPEVVEEKMKEESPDEAAARIMKDILKEMTKK